jgi:hypothetical protein
MKLNEPLAGIKLIQGHFVMHLALFMSSILFVETRMYTDQKGAFQQVKWELQIFYYLSFGHLLTALLQLFKWLIDDVKGWTLFANSIQVTTLFTYLTPLFFSMWCTQNITNNLID